MPKDHLDAIVAAILSDTAVAGGVVLMFVDGVTTLAITAMALI